MKKIISLILVVALTSQLTACSKPLDIGENKTIPTYGFINKDQKKDPNYTYEVSIGNVVWSIILCETIIAPIYFLGFSLYNPVKKIETPTEVKK